jgi:hypothetical protein
MKRPQQPEKPVEAKPNYKCSDTNCDLSVRGFDTQAELDAHFKDAHPHIDDPLKFALESLSSSLGLDKDGNEKIPKVTARAPNRGIPPPSRIPPQAAKPGQTLATKQDVSTPAQSAATPMARVATQTSAIKGSPSTNLLRTPQTGAKVATPSTGHGPRGTPTTSKFDPKETVKPAEREKTPDLWANAAFDPEVLRGIIDSMNIPLMRAQAPPIEDSSWIPKSLETLPLSPALTPESSKDSTSTRSSDISEMDNLQINVAVDPWDSDYTLPSLDIYEDLRMRGLLDDIDFGVDPDGKTVYPVLSWENTFGKLETTGDGADSWGSGDWGV